MRLKYYNNDPRIITAKFNSKCAETGVIINKGSECLYYPSSREVFSLDSKQASDFRGWSFDCEVLGANY